MAVSSNLNEICKRIAGEVEGPKLAAALALEFASILADTTLGEGVDIVTGTTTGSKIGTAVSQKIGFWNATPVIQQASAAQGAVTPSTDLTGGDTVSAAGVLAAVQAVETLVNRLRADLVTVGIIKGAA